jgi:hypothetical protein
VDWFSIFCSSKPTHQTYIDLEFVGGAIGWRAGSQQYTARNLNFNGCITAVEMIWDWGFNWQQVLLLAQPARDDAKN